MNRRLKIGLLIVSLIIENALLVASWSIYKDNKNYKEELTSNKGLNEKCESLQINDDLFSVLKKMKGYSTHVQVNSETFFLNYGDERGPEAMGTALLFSKNYKLTNRSCDSNWTPDLPVIPK